MNGLKEKHIFDDIEVKNFIEADYYEGVCIEHKGYIKKSNVEQVFKAWVEEKKKELKEFMKQHIVFMDYADENGTYSYFESENDEDNVENRIDKIVDDVFKSVDAKQEARE